MGSKKKLKKLLEKKSLLLTSDEIPKYAKDILLKKYEKEIIVLQEKINIKKDKKKKKEIEKITEIIELKNNNIKKRKNDLLVPTVTIEQLNNRSKRFKENEIYKPEIIQNNKNKIVGLSTSYEKKYYRLTGPPDPYTVRPENILFDAFQYFRKKWLSTRNYEYIKEQLKSIRQDLLIQNIKNQYIYFKNK